MPNLALSPGDADVGALQDLGAARDGRTLDRGDQRLGQATALQQRVDARRVVAAVLERIARRLGRRGLEVHPRAEVAARAGEDAGADLRIVVDAIPGLDHDREHLGGQRVARLWPVQRQDQGVSALLNEGVGALLRFASLTDCSPSSVDATDLSGNVTRSSLGSVALNIADLAEHAIDAVPDRVALICGDDQLTYAQLEEKANRLGPLPHRPGRQEGRQDRSVLPEPHRDRDRRCWPSSRWARSWSTSTSAMSRASCAISSTTPTWSRWCTSASYSRPGGQRAARDPEGQDGRCDRGR